MAVIHTLGCPLLDRTPDTKNIQQMTCKNKKKSSYSRTLEKLAIFAMFLTFVPLTFASAWQSETYDAGTGVYQYEHKQNNDTAIQYSPANGSNANYFQNGFEFQTAITGASVKSIALPICNNGGSGSFKVLLLSGADQQVVSTMTTVATFTQRIGPLDCGLGTGQQSPAVYSTTTAIALSAGNRYKFVILGDTMSLHEIALNAYVPPIKWISSEGLYPNTSNGANLPIFFWSSYYGDSYYVGGDHCINSDGTTNRTGANCTGTPLYAPDFTISSLDYSVPGLQGVCGSSPFSCVVGDPVNTVFASSTYTWYCTGVLGGATSSCMEFAASSSPITTPYPTYTPDSACSITSGDGIVACLKNAFYWAIIPPQSSFQQFYDLMDALKKKPPAGYFTAYSAVFDFNASSSSSTVLVLVDAGSPLMTYVFTPLRTVLLTIIFIFAAVWFFRRVKDIHI